MNLTEATVAEYAETLVRQVAPGNVVLDYTEESIALVEALIARSDPQLADPELPAAQRDLVIFYNGCYVGETLARTLGGVWRFDDDWSDASLIFPCGDGGLQTHPFHKLYRRVTEKPEDNNLVAYYRGLKERLQAPSGDDGSAAE